MRHSIYSLINGFGLPQRYSVYELIQKFPDRWPRKIYAAVEPPVWEQILEDIQKYPEVIVPFHTPNGFGELRFGGRHYFNGRYYLVS